MRIWRCSTPVRLGRSQNGCKLVFTFLLHQDTMISIISKMNFRFKEAIKASHLEYAQAGMKTEHIEEFDQLVLSIAIFTKEYYLNAEA